MNAQDRTKIASALTALLDEIQSTMVDARNTKGEVVRDRGLIKEQLIRFQGAMTLAMVLAPNLDPEIITSTFERWKAYRDEMYGDT